MPKERNEMVKKERKRVVEWPLSELFSNRLLMNEWGHFNSCGLQ